MTHDLGYDYLEDYADELDGELELIKDEEEEATYRYY